MTYYFIWLLDNMIIRYDKIRYLDKNYRNYYDQIMFVSSNKFSIYQIILANS